MIVRATLQVTLDDGSPVILATGERLMVQGNDIESNVLKVQAELDDLVVACQDAVKKQVRQWREKAPALQAEAEGRDVDGV